ncbi:FAD-dependent oxidoreductase [Pseudoflavonifractor sp. P01025]|uniref:FAD-dependent oxidoreductase n=1 Tax=Flintibacter porci TaxID=3342383 RepID=UPI000B370470|nr:FAD-dependent oxidoreductase [Flavonifractor sp. An135]MDY3692712.1 FAD-dependent oxidoreductase [Dysosmobacter sp.]OUQ26998.1 thioredoxin reductase [Flavonifractor sp. An135]
MEQMEHLYDVVVIGGGPAGLTAALYLARARYRVVVVEQERFGGQITITSEVVNYPGVERTSGAELTETMRRQAERFGAEFLLAEVTGLELEGDVKTVRTSRGALSCFGVLLATGAHPRMVGFRGEEQFRGRGVAYCATCDGEFFTGKDVFVVGGGFAAAEESVFLTKYARHVTILIRGDDFTCAQATADAARNHEKITILTNTVVEEVSGDTALRSIRMRNTKTGEETEHQAADGETFGVFVFAGYEPATELVRGLAELDGQGYVLTDRSQKTTADGLYAAGDVCVKPLRQVVTAVGDGALAATELERLCAAMQQKTGLRPQAPKSRTPEPEAKTQTNDSLFTGEMLSQLQTVFERMASPLILRLCLDETPVSAELEHYMQELAAQSDKLSVEQGDPSKVQHLPCVQICRSDGSWTGLAFHGVPGGHEFTSFVLGLYNAAGPGQALDEDTEAAIRAIRKPVELQVLVSLSCTMCPELVTAAQRLAAAHPDISAQVYDLNHFPDLREQYQVMSVPCLVVNRGEQISFGKKNIRQLLELLMP